MSKNNLIWETEKRKISTLNVFEKNPRILNKKEKADLVKSLNKFDLVEIPAIDLDNTILAGHQRLKVLQELKGDIEIDVRVPSRKLTDKEQEEYLIRSNKNTGIWDFEMLETSFDTDELIDWGFNPDELNIEDVVEGLTDEDATPEEPKKIYIERGDLIELGEHRLLCGDSTSEDDVDKLMGGEKADMVFTDPPYGVSYSNNMNDNHEVIKNDDVFLDGWIPLVDKYSKGFVFVWTSYQVVDRWIEITNDIGKMTNMIIWSKGGGGLGDLTGAFATDFEIALVFNRGAKLKSKRIGSVWNVAKDDGASYLHPTQKPVELMSKGITNCSKYKDIVLDLFLGSGSTLIACQQNKRKCYGMELDEKYAQVIIQRWCEFTGIYDIKINGKEVNWLDIIGEE